MEKVHSSGEMVVVMMVSGMKDIHMEPELFAIKMGIPSKEIGSMVIDMARANIQQVIQLSKEFGRMNIVAE